MIDFALNHMTVPRTSYCTLIDVAVRLACTGVEARNDLGKPLFDGRDPGEAGAMARDRGLRIHSVAEIKQFDAWDRDRALEARALVRIAAAAGAEAVCLIPRNDGAGTGDGERRANVRAALREIRPMVEDAGIAGLVEPLGFETCALRYKSEAVEAIEDLDAAGTFRLVHDTFHHHLAGGGPFFRSIRGSSTYPASWIRVSTPRTWRTSTASSWTSATGSATPNRLRRWSPGDMEGRYRSRSSLARFTTSTTRSPRSARRWSQFARVWRPPPDARFVTP